MSFFREYQNYKDEIDLALIQNGCVEIELYSIIASLIRESQNKCNLSVRDVSNRRKSPVSEKFYGNAGFPDFVILNREKDPDNITIYGCVEAKMPTIELNKKDEQIQDINDIIDRSNLSSKRYMNYHPNHRNYNFNNYRHENILRTEPNKFSEMVGSHSFYQKDEGIIF